MSAVNRLIAATLAVAVSLTAAPLPLPAAEAPAAPARKPLVQIAILLDCSGSMDGLIDQARTQLWRIVNEFSAARRGGQMPRLEVALYEYGKSEIPAAEHYLRMVLPLSTDLDKVSEELFKLKTNGGEEYCGWVIKSAVEGLKWSAEKDDLKLIFVCGNEPFTQGDLDYKIAVKAAVDKGIIVNTIFCGNPEEGVATNWKDGADKGGGKYLAINQDKRPVAVAAPQDKEIAALGEKLNATYIPVGSAGREGQARQQAQDANAAAANGQVLAQRNAAKSSANYHCAWDLCDSLREGKIKIEDVKEEDLPENLRKMSKDERKAFVEAKMKERTEVQEKIRKLNAERDAFVAAELRKLAASGEDTLDAAVIKAVREEAAAKGFKFE
jgi:hypothetical protein